MSELQAPNQIEDGGIIHRMGFKRRHAIVGLSLSVMAACGAMMDSDAQGPATVEHATMHAKYVQWGTKYRIEAAEGVFTDGSAFDSHKTMTLFGIDHLARDTTSHIVINGVGKTQVFVPVSAIEQKLLGPHKENLMLTVDMSKVLFNLYHERVHVGMSNDDMSDLYGIGDIIRRHVGLSDRGAELNDADMSAAESVEQEMLHWVANNCDPELRGPIMQSITDSVHTIAVHLSGNKPENVLVDLSNTTEVSYDFTDDVWSQRFDANNPTHVDLNDIHFDEATCNTVKITHPEEQATQPEQVPQTGGN